MDAPVDKYYLTYITFLVHGIGILMPWNMFITAIGYFTQYKLSSSYIGYDYPFLSKFMQYLTFCSQIPAVILSWMNIFVRIKGKLTIRIVWSIGVVIVVFIFTIFMAMLDTSRAPNFFFWSTMLCVVIMNSANGVYQNSIFGLIAKLPGKYTAAVILGNNISGTFASIVSLISKLSTPNLKLAAIWYFIMALFVLLLCFDTYFALPLNKYYRFYDEHEKQVEQQGKSSSGETERPPYWKITKQAFPQLANVFLVFFVTLAVFPALQAGIQKSNKNFFVSDYVYVDVMCFLTFNVFAMIGSWLPTYVIWPGPKLLWIPVTVRLIYIPLFLFCNYQVEGVTRNLPVLIKNDYIYFLIGATMAISSGYLSSLAMMYAPGTVEERYAQTAAMIAAAALLSGIFTGILIAFIWPGII
ncbi:equilibrative nucleoside transporter 1-like [Diabrotica undecimpunctata]|uniref:equilibrative nucleoside transporter 1-like n=1 Tax=Diabrotica undecimpunctata TaxID=50387 RepID=UPI003B640FE0